MSAFELKYKEADIHSAYTGDNVGVETRRIIGHSVPAVVIPKPTFAMLPMMQLRLELGGECQVPAGILKIRLHEPIRGRECAIHRAVPAV